MSTLVSLTLNVPKLLQPAWLALVCVDTELGDDNKDLIITCRCRLQRSCRGDRRPVESVGLELVLIALGSGVGKPLLVREVHDIDLVSLLECEHLVTEGSVAGVVHLGSTTGSSANILEHLLLLIPHGLDVSNDPLKLLLDGGRPCEVTIKLGVNCEREEVLDRREHARIVDIVEAVGLLVGQIKQILQQ